MRYAEQVLVGACSFTRSMGCMSNAGILVRLSGEACNIPSVESGQILSHLSTPPLDTPLHRPTPFSSEISPSLGLICLLLSLVYIVFQLCWKFWQAVFPDKVSHTKSPPFIARGQRGQCRAAETTRCLAISTVLTSYM